MSWNPSGWQPDGWQPQGWDAEGETTVEGSVTGRLFVIGGEQTLYVVAPEN